PASLGAAFLGCSADPPALLACRNRVGKASTRAPFVGAGGGHTPRRRRDTRAFACPGRGALRCYHSHAEIESAGARLRVRLCLARSVDRAGAARRARWLAHASLEPRDG